MPYPDSSGTDCPILGCKRRRGEDRLLCFPHWKMVPVGLQREIWGTWSARKKALAGDGAVYQKARAAHEDAKRRAIEAVEKAEARRAEPRLPFEEPR